MKTWEMIKKLAENPDLKFRSIHGDKVQVIDGVLCWHTGEPFELNTNGFKMREGITTAGTIEKYEWEEIKKPSKYIKAVHFGSLKLYTWRVPEELEKVPFRKGDIVEVRTMYGIQLAEVREELMSEFNENVKTIKSLYRAINIPF